MLTSTFYWLIYYFKWSIFLRISFFPWYGEVGGSPVIYFSPLFLKLSFLEIKYPSSFVKIYSTHFNVSWMKVRFQFLSFPPDAQKKTKEKRTKDDFTANINLKDLTDFSSWVLAFNRCQLRNKEQNHLYRTPLSFDCRSLSIPSSLSVQNSWRWIFCFLSHFCFIFTVSPFFVVEDRFDCFQWGWRQTGRNYVS